MHFADEYSVLFASVLQICVNGRPFMGPNAYLTPPGSFTQVHQDGHGTVDSGHLCLTGYNEVVMLRRLPERHKIHALELLRRGGRGEKYDGLYGLPHADVCELVLRMLCFGLYSSWPQCFLTFLFIGRTRKARLADRGWN